MISRDLCVAETTFSPSHEVTLELGSSTLEPGVPYMILPCTYDPGKSGEFMLYATSDAPLGLADEPPNDEEVAATGGPNEEMDHEMLGETSYSGGFAPNET